MGPLEFVFGPRRPKGYVPPAEKIALKEANKTLPPKSDEATGKKGKEKTAGVWVAYKDRYGKPCWQNRNTGKWTYEQPDAREVFQHPQQQFVVVPNPPAPAPGPPVVLAPGQQWVPPQPHWNNPGGGPFPLSPVPVFVPALPNANHNNMNARGEAKVFVPSPIPGQFQSAPWGPGIPGSPVMSPVVSPVPVVLTVPTKGNAFEADEDEDEGTWERKMAADRSSYWVNTATGERKLQDPYF